MIPKIQYFLRKYEDLVWASFSMLSTLFVLLIFKFSTENIVKEKGDSYFIFLTLLNYWLIFPSIFSDQLSFRSTNQNLKEKIFSNILIIIGIGLLSTHFIQTKNNFEILIVLLYPLVILLDNSLILNGKTSNSYQTQIIINLTVIFGALFFVYSYPVSFFYLIGIILCLIRNIVNFNFSKKYLLNLRKFLTTNNLIEYIDRKTLLIALVKASGFAFLLKDQLVIEELSMTIGLYTDYSLFYKIGFGITTLVLSININRFIFSTYNNKYFQYRVFLKPSILIVIGLIFSITIMPYSIPKKLIIFESVFLLVKYFEQPITNFYMIRGEYGLIAMYNCLIFLLSVIFIYVLDLETIPSFSISAVLAFSIYYYHAKKCDLRFR